MIGMGTVVIGGGSGFIGKTLSKILRAKGYGVVIVSRKPGPFSMTWSELSDKGLPENSTAVISLAGQNVLDPTRRWTPGFKQNVWSSRVHSTRSLAEAIKKLQTPPKVFASISGVGFYKPSETEEYTEYSIGGNHDFLSRLCKDWEEAGELPNDINTRRVVVRSGVVLGRQGGMIQQIFLPFYFGLGGPIGTGNQFMPWIHIQDIAGIFLHAIENEVKGILNGVAPEIITNREFTKAFAAELRRPALIPLPVKVLNMAFSPERAIMMTEGQKVIPQRTLEMGYKYIFPDIRSACKEFAHLIYKKK
ncbi:epimerase family protein SDR39U1-like isoform X1 [Centruroides sculpturatus]|uniref:epimerase family protein SDR39U1-like isoform X1 n=2 Tax=Centruroides sculpturatus TaxID=218467 RepID=UPI000C6D0FF4|nr:epimerase family protein SDR39U1-like isoform X1 [Centruroides sculpturatus]